MHFSPRETEGLPRNPQTGSNCLGISADPPRKHFACFVRWPRLHPHGRAGTLLPDAPRAAAAQLAREQQCIAGEAAARPGRDVLQCALASLSWRQAADGDRGPPQRPPPRARTQGLRMSSPKRQCVEAARKSASTPGLAADLTPKARDGDGAPGGSSERAVRGLLPATRWHSCTSAQTN